MTAFFFGIAKLFNDFHQSVHHNDLNLLWTLSRVPVINVPKFKCPNDLPYGFQIIGPRYSDYSVLNFLKYLVEEGIAPEISEVCMPT